MDDLEVPGLGTLQAVKITMRWCSDILSARKKWVPEIELQNMGR
jgi:hypothetical protein